MPSDLPRFTLRLEKKYLLKLKRIADKNGRSLNNQIGQVLKRFVDNYEMKYKKDK